MKQDDRVRIYVDGACRGNPGPGGWGAVLMWGGRQREICGGEPSTTNNRMELTAAIRALEALKRPVEVELYSDSTYVVKGMTEWLRGWRERGWRRKSGKLENRDLWQRLDELVQQHRVHWRWVRGHADDPLNARAHQLATGEVSE